MTVTWSDNFTIWPSWPNQVGQWGQMNYLINVDGTANAVGRWYYTPEDGCVTCSNAGGVMYYRIGDFSEKYIQLGYSRGDCGQDPFEPVLLQDTIMLGQSYSFYVTLVANTRVWTESSSSVDNNGNMVNLYDFGSAYISLERSLSWGGIQSLTVDGQPIEFTVTSESGFDYSKPFSQPVPIPSAVWLIGSGLIGLAGLRRKLRVRS